MPTTAKTFLEQLTELSESDAFKNKGTWAIGAERNYHTSKEDGSWWVEPSDDQQCLEFRGQLFHDKNKKLVDYVPSTPVTILKVGKGNKMCWMYACLNRSMDAANRMFINISSMWNEAKLNNTIAQWKLHRTSDGHLEFKGVGAKWMEKYMLAIEEGQVREKAPTVETISQQEATLNIEEELERQALDVSFRAVEEEQPVEVAITEKTRGHSLDDEPFGNPRDFPQIGRRSKLLVEKVI